MVVWQQIINGDMHMNKVYVTVTTISLLLTAYFSHLVYFQTVVLGETSVQFEKARARGDYFAKRAIWAREYNILICSYSPFCWSVPTH